MELYDVLNMFEEILRFPLIVHLGFNFDFYVSKIKHLSARNLPHI